MLNALRLVEGFAEELFAARTGLARPAIEPALERAAALGLVERAAGRLRPSSRGRLFLNDLLELFLEKD